MHPPHPVKMEFSIENKEREQAKQSYKALPVKWILSDGRVSQGEL